MPDNHKDHYCGVFRHLLGGCKPWGKAALNFFVDFFIPLFMLLKVLNLTSADLSRKQLKCIVRVIFSKVFLFYGTLMWLIYFRFSVVLCGKCENSPGKSLKHKVGVDLSVSARIGWVISLAENRVITKNYTI